MNNPTIINVLTIIFAMLSAVLGQKIIFDPTDIGSIVISVLSAILAILTALRSGTLVKRASLTQNGELNEPTEVLAQRRANEANKKYGIGQQQ